MTSTSIVSSMSLDLLIPLHDLEYVIRSAPKRYKVYRIKKRGGAGERTIAQPAVEVKYLQYWVMTNVLRQFPIHDAATAYRSGAGIIQNAGRHARNRFLLKLDFRNFFNSLRSVDWTR